METRTRLILVSVVASILFACTKEKTEIVENVIEHDQYNERDVESIYASAFNTDFKKTVDGFNNKFGMNLDKIELLKACSKFSIDKFNDAEIEGFKRQIEGFTQFLQNPKFKDKDVQFTCYRGRNYYSSSPSGIEFYDPSPIKSIKGNEKKTEKIALFSENVAPIEYLVNNYAGAVGTEPVLQESYNRLRNRSLANFDKYLDGHLISFHEDMIELITDGSIQFTEELLTQLIQNNFSGYSLIKVDWDNALGIFGSRSNFIRVIFGNDKNIFDYRIILNNFNLSLSVYQANSEKEKLLQLLQDKKSLTDLQSGELDGRFLLASGYYQKSQGTSSLTKYERNASGQISSVTKSECDGDMRLFNPSASLIFNLKEHSVCSAKVDKIDAFFRVQPFDSGSLLSGEDLTFDKSLPSSSEIIVGLIGAGVDYNDTKVNWRLLRKQNSLEAYNQIFSGELPFESYFFNSPFLWGDGFSFGSALTALSAYGSDRIKVLPIKINPFEPDFEQILALLESKGAKIALVSSSVFKYFNQKKGFSSLSSAIQNHAKLFVVVDAGNQGVNLNRLKQHVGCVASSHSIVVTASLVNQLAVRSDANFGNQCVELALDGNSFETNKSFTKRVNERFNTTNPDTIASGFAAAKLVNYLARNILTNTITADTAKAYILSKSNSVSSLEPYVKEGKVLPSTEIQFIK